MCKSIFLVWLVMYSLCFSFMSMKLGLIILCFFRIHFSNSLCVGLRTCFFRINFKCFVTYTTIVIHLFGTKIFEINWISINWVVHKRAASFHFVRAKTFSETFVRVKTFCRTNVPAFVGGGEDEQRPKILPFLNYLMDSTIDFFIIFWMMNFEK